MIYDHRVLRLRFPFLFEIESCAAIMMHIMMGGQVSMSKVSSETRDVFVFIVHIQ